MSNTSDFIVSQPKFDDDAGSYGRTLLCPSCGNSWTHHTSVTVFDRTEDAEIGRKTVATGAATTVDSDITGNPSGRRNGLVIGFDCENCPTVMEMDVFQHKGQTFFRMRHKTDQENDPRKIYNLD